MLLKMGFPNIVIVYGLDRNKSEKLMELVDSAGLGNIVYPVHMKLKPGQWRNLCFLVEFYLEMAFKGFNGSHKIVFYDISSIM